MSLLLLLSGVGNVTGVARLSLALANTPTTRTNHAIVLRGRILSGTGKLMAALYEAGFNRSGDLVSPSLSFVLTDYTLIIPDANAALIGGYTNLELRVWGITTDLAPVTYELAEAKLTLPSGTLFNAAGYETGVGTDSATLSIFSQTSKVAGDNGFGSDIASVTSNVTASITMPELALEVSFDADSGPTYTEAIVIDRPVVYYRLDESSGAVVDRSGNLNLTAIGGITRSQASLITGDSNTCYDFNGTTGYLGAAEPGDFDTDLLTLEAIVRPDTIVAEVIMSRFNQTFDTDVWVFSIVNGFLQFKMRDIAANEYVYVSTASVPVATTSHVSVIVRTNSIDFLVNGILIDSIPKSWEEMARTVEGLFTIGARFTGTSYVDFFDGKIDEPAVYLIDLEKEQLSYHSSARAVVSAYTWTLISGDTPTNSYLKEISIKRGSQDIFRDPETGVFTGILYNNDRRFDPGQTTSPYYPNLKPARPVRLRVTKDGISRNLFRGDIEDWPQEWHGRDNDVSLSALDGFDILAGVDVRMTRPIESAGDRIHAILDAAAWPKELRQIDQGQSLVAAWNGEESSARELLFRVMHTESGEVYINGSGFVVFQERNKRFLVPNSTVKVTLSNIPGVGELPLVDAQVVEDKDQIKNHVRIKVADTSLVGVAQDDQSILDHRKRSFEQELPIVSQDEAYLKAQWVLSLFKNPLLRVKDIVLEPQMDPVLWAHCLDREIGDRIRMKIFPPGKPGTMHDIQATIEYIEHKYIVKRWTTLWRLSPTDTTDYWTVGDDDLDTETKLAY